LCTDIFLLPANILPKTITAKDHRTPYSTDSIYFSSPNSEDIFELVYDMMHEAVPVKYPEIY